MAGGAVMAAVAVATAVFGTTNSAGFRLQLYAAVAVATANCGLCLMLCQA